MNDQSLSEVSELNMIVVEDLHCPCLLTELVLTVASSSSGFTPYHSPGSSASNSNSCNSLQRRYVRSKTKSLEYHLHNRQSDEPHSEVGVLY